jgi:bifunctional non-homologous end joining protein LigD
MRRLATKGFGRLGRPWDSFQVERRLDWQASEEFCRGVAETLVPFSPSEYLATLSKAKRRGRISIDFMRNTRGATFIAPYSTRARPGAPVAVPIGRDELSPELRGDFVTLRDLGRWSRGRRDPWANLARVRQSITERVLKAVEATSPRPRRR